MTMIKIKDYDYYEILDDDTFKIHGLKKHLNHNRSITFETNLGLDYNCYVSSINDDFTIIKKY